MADFLVTGSVGSNVAFDELAGPLYVGRIKLIHGADGVNDGDTSTANPFPVRLYVGTTTLNLGSGVATGALRTTLASDDPTVVALQIIDNIVSGAGVNVSAINGVAPTMGNGGSGTGVQRVTIANDSTGIVSLTTSTASIGKLAANAGVTIGAVEFAAAQTIATVTAVTSLGTITGSIVPGTSATHLGKAIDSVPGATDTGVACLVVRDDALSTLTPVDGDYTTPRVDSTGQLWVRLGGLTVYTTDDVYAAGTGLASLLIRDDALTTLTPADADWAGPGRVDSVGALWVRDRVQLVDDAAFTPGTSFVTPIGMQADETGADSVDEGDVGCPRMTLDRKQRVVAEMDSTSIRGGTTARTPVFVVISAASSPDNTLVAALGGSLKIRVLSLFVVATGGANTIRFESGASGTALTGQMDLATEGQLILPFSPVGHFETAADTLLNLELSAATSVAGGLCYIPVD